MKKVSVAILLALTSLVSCMLFAAYLKTGIDSYLLLGYTAFFIWLLLVGYHAGSIKRWMK